MFSCDTMRSKKSQTPGLGLQTICSTARAHREQMSSVLNPVAAEER